jgi:hypothetical protein
MKKLIAAGVIIPLAILAFTGPATAKPTATNPKLFFDGTTAQGQEVFFIVEKIGGVPNFEPFFTNFTLTCPDGTTSTFEWFFIGFQIPLPSTGRFELAIPGNQIPFDWKGRIQGKQAAGTQSQGYAAYDLSGGVQDCGTGDVGWKATGVGSSSHPGGTTHGYRVSVVKQHNGKIRETVTSG